MNKLLLMMAGQKKKPWYMPAGVPRPVAVYQPFGAADLTSSYKNLANPSTHLASATTAPTLTKNVGWVFGASAFVITDLVPAAGWSVIVKYRDLTTTNIALMGEGKSGAYFQINPNQATNGMVFSNGGQLQIYTNTNTTGTLAMSGKDPSGVAYKNGAALSGNITRTWTATADAIYIGATNNSGTAGSKLTGNIQAVAFYDSPLTDAQVLAIHNKLMALTTIYRLVCDGDSLTAGSGADAGYDYPSQTQALLGWKWEKSNLGVGGQTIADMLTDAVSQVDALYKADRGRCVVACWGGHNDLNAARSGADIYADITTYITGRKAAGYKVVVATIKPSTALTGGEETQRLALNVLIKANAAGADAIADVASAPELQDPNNATYFTDGTHLTNAGYAVVSRVMTAAIMSIG